MWSWLVIRFRLNRGLEQNLSSISHWFPSLASYYDLRFIVHGRHNIFKLSEILSSLQLPSKMITLNIDSRLALPNIYPPIRRIQIPAYIRLFRYRSDFRPVPVISSSLPPPHSRLLRLHRAYDLFTRLWSHLLRFITTKSTNCHSCDHQKTNTGKVINSPNPPRFSVLQETTPQISGFFCFIFYFWMQTYYVFRSMFDHTPPLRALFNRPQQLFTQHTKPYIYHCFGV